MRDKCRPFARATMTLATMTKSNRAEPNLLAETLQKANLRNRLLTSKLCHSLVRLAVAGPYIKKLKKSKEKKQNAEKAKKKSARKTK